MTTQEQTHESRELELYTTNDSDLYRQRQLPIQKNLTKKYEKGTYDHVKAVTLWMYLIDDGAKKYCKEFGLTKKWFAIFTKEIRLETAQVLADHYLAEMKLGNFTE